MLQGAPGLSAGAKDHKGKWFPEKRKNVNGGAKLSRESFSFKVPLTKPSFETLASIIVAFVENIKGDLLKASFYRYHVEIVIH